MFRAGPERRQPRATLPTPATAPGPDTTTDAPPPMSAPAGETHRAGVRQTRHEVGPAPPITSAPTAIHPGGQPLMVESMFAIGLRPTTTTLANAAAEGPGPFGVRSALPKTTNFSRGFCGWFRASAQRAARQAVGPAVFPAPAFHGRSAHQPRWPKGLRATPPPMPDQREMPMKQRDPEEHGPAAPGHMTHGPAGRVSNPA